MLVRSQRPLLGNSVCLERRGSRHAHSEPTRSNASKHGSRKPSLCKHALLVVSMHGKPTEAWMNDQSHTTTQKETLAWSIDSQTPHAMCPVRFRNSNASKWSCFV
eukprot:TRINITY_DN66426_c0_g1_i1.p1 TRINITY_DN66426_c0_g1~~TRINITY_DN66426_c0_g1_i1.p1  ORF type:complete len:105 (+),score=8.81 TRINITY_DN66426_c0_g1_i1:33-347(+)